MTDPLVEGLIADTRRRSEKAHEEYGVGLDRTDLSAEDWLAHLEEELVDAALYARRLRVLLRRMREAGPQDAAPVAQEAPERRAARAHQWGEHAMGCPPVCPWAGGG